jgi:hypothetical protein
VHYFIYRDPRGVAVSEAHYYRSINRWHRLHPLFRDAPSMSDAVMLALRGVADPSGRLYYPDIGTRFRHYQPWISAPDVFAVRFEDLASQRREPLIKAMMDFYVKKAGDSAKIDDLCQKALANISPEKSHTFRKGISGAWREVFTDAHRDAFKDAAGDILIDCGYESNNDW